LPGLFQALRDNRDTHLCPILLVGISDRWLWH
jgi:hypothetical protein